MPEISRNNPVTKRNEKMLFCHIPRTNGEAIIEALKHSGWSISNNFWGDEVDFPTYWQINAHYKTLDQKFPKSFAICRHPMRRLESAFFHKRRATCPLDMFSQIAEMSTERFYTSFDRHLRPANDLILDAATVYHHEIGLAQIFNKLQFLGIVKPSAKIKAPPKSERRPVDWTTAPRHVIEKVSQIYAEDYYNFEYPLFPSV